MGVVIPKTRPHPSVPHQIQRKQRSGKNPNRNIVSVPLLLSVAVVPRRGNLSTGNKSEHASSVVASFHLMHAKALRERLILLHLI